VAPRQLKDLRFPETSPFAEPYHAGSFLSIYWRHQGLENAGQNWDGPSVFWLYENGRGFSERTHAHTANYDFMSVAYKDDDGVPIELALDHDYAGLAVVVTEPSGGVSSEQLLAWLEASAAPLLFAHEGPDAIASWTLNEQFRSADRREAPMSLGTAGGDENRVLQLCFLNTEPTRCWDAFRRYGEEIDRGGVGRVSFAAPFLPTVIGTDTYVDQIW
jgi:hypothetical protein